MARARAVTGLKLVTTRGKTLGQVEHALFHPDEPRVVGFQVARPRFAYVVERKRLFVPLSEVRVGTERLDGRHERLLTGRKAASRLGFDWDASVIWTGMPVRTRGGRRAGAVYDAQFDDQDGTVTKLVLSEGVGSDVAVGRRTIDGANVRGFFGEEVVIDDVLGSAEFSGGVAATAGRGAAVARKAATDAAVKAVAAGKATARAAAETEMGRRALGALRGIVREVKDAMSADEDEDES
jgi:uncharacterized protein YrrD